MFAHIFLAVAAATATPAPTPMPAPDLKTIANVRASARCSAIVSHANDAIVATLSDNEVIGQTITQLRMTNLDDGSIIHRNAGLNALRDLAAQLNKQSHSGDGEIKTLRTLAAQTPDPAQKKDLKAFADALGGALGRQLKMARDLNGFLAYADYRDMRELDAIGETPIFENFRPTLTQYAQRAADDFQGRFPLVVKDENQAATHVDGALGGC